MALPQPPSVGQAISGPRGGYTPNPQGTLPYPESGTSSFVQGISSFMQNFVAAKKAEKEEALREAEQNLRLLTMGIPVDQKQIVKSLQRAGVKLDLNAPDPSLVKKYQDEQDQRNALANNPALLGSAAGVGVGPGQIPPASTAPPTAAPTPRPGLGQRILQGLGITAQPTPAPNAPIYAALSQLQQAGQLQRANQIGEMQYKSLTQGLLKAAAEGNKHAMLLVGQLGIAPKLTSDEYLTLMGSLTGKTPLENYDVLVNAHLAPYYSVLAQSAANTARLTFDQRKEYSDMMVKLTDTYPNAPPEAVDAYVTGLLGGNKKLMDAGAQLMWQTPSKAMLEARRAETEAARKERETRVAEGNLRLRGEELSFSKVKQSAEEMNQLKGRALQLAKDMITTMNSKEFQALDQDSQNSAIQVWVEAINKADPSTTLTVEKVWHWYDIPSWFKSRAQVRYSGTPSPNLDKMMGGGTTKPAAPTAPAAASTPSPSWFEKMMTNVWGPRPDWYESEQEEQKAKPEEIR